MERLADRDWNLAAVKAARSRLSEPGERPASQEITVIVPKHDQSIGRKVHPGLLLPSFDRAEVLPTAQEGASQAAGNSPNAKTFMALSNLAILARHAVMSMIKMGVSALKRSLTTNALREGSHRAA